MRFFKLNIFLLIIIFMAADVIFTGMGMGVPFLNIFFGFFTGWYAAVRALNLYSDRIFIFKRTLIYNLFCAGFTFIVMAVIWGRASILLLNESTDYAEFGHPMILYEPRISFIGWLVLMIVISPFLQLLASVFSSYLTFTFYRKKTV